MFLMGRNVSGPSRVYVPFRNHKNLQGSRCLVGGDFNLRLGWSQKKGAHDRVKAFVNHHGWVWPTETQTETVQHVIHSPDLVADVTIDSSVRHTKGKKDRLSDHPFVLVQVQDGE